MSSDTADPRKPGLREIFGNRKLLIIMALGAASGFPNQITESALQAWLKDAGRSNTSIGLLTYVAIPYLLKFLWAPLLDRFPLPLLGRRRGWLLAIQLFLAISIASLSIQNPAVSLSAVAITALVIVFFSASQDIVIDAYRTDISLPEERGLAAAANNLGYRACAWLAFAAALIVADSFGWRAAFLVLAAAMAAFTIFTWLAPEPDYRAPPPSTLRQSVIVPLRELLGSPGALGLIVLIVTFKIGGAMALKLFTPFLIDLGFSKTEIGLVAKAVLTTSAIAGGVLGGLWMVRLGLLRSMLLFGVLQTVTILAFYLLAITGKSFPLMIAATAIENLTAAMGNIAEVALIMALCNSRFSAFEYALLSVLALLPRYLLGGPAGWLADHGGWSTYYIVTFLVGIPGLAMVWVMRHRIAALDVRR
ncbi:MAG: AmpG family muropeptide MFS transporter [Steroidobacteraceae bacterium]